MSKAIRLFFIAVAGCLMQTNLSQYIQIADVAPDLMIALIVALTSYCGMLGCFSASALMIMFYDATVGYVMALNLIAYIAFSLLAPALRKFFDEKMSKLKHKSVMVMMIICAMLTLFREIAYVVYLFLIGAEFGALTIVRVFLCAGYTALMTIPCIFFVRGVMNWHPFNHGHRRRNKKNLLDDDVLLP